MDATYAKPFEYVIPWKSASVQLGSHRGTQRGLGFEYRGNVNLVDYPDARRMDIRETLRDPFEQIQVRQFNQESTTPIYVLGDLSSSMQFKGEIRKLETAIEISIAVANAASQAGDLFGFIGYNDEVIEDYTLPLSRDFHQSKDVIAALKTYQKMHAGYIGVTDAPNFLVQDKSLVFWLSDFHMPLSVIQKTMAAMSVHQVIPIVLWDDQEYKKLPKFGFSTMIDPETGLNRTIFFRKEIKEKFVAAFEERKNALEKLFLKFESPALFVDGDYNAEVVSHYFEQYMTQ
jgi:uncharacterized protein (DUF58 family)